MKTTPEIIAQIETLLGELKSSLGVESRQGDRKILPTKTAPAFTGLTGEIYNLIQEGFFKEPKTISEVQDKLRVEGINKPTTTLMAPLLLLIRRKVLGRSKPQDGKGGFKYFQR